MSHTDSDVHSICCVWLDWNEIRLYYREIVAIYPESELRIDCSVDDAELVCFALFEMELMAWLFSCALRIEQWITVIDTFTVHDVRVWYRWASFHFLVVQREGVSMIPVTDQDGAKVLVVIHARGTINMDGAFKIVNAEANLLQPTGFLPATPSASSWKSVSCSRDKCGSTYTED